MDSNPLPVCDYAGFAPFGFGFTGGAGEQRHQVFEEFLRKVWRDKSLLAQFARSAGSVSRTR
jgi:hypothetical protein